MLLDVARSLTTEYILRKNYLQKIRKQEIQVKIMVTKQATMGMRAQEVFFNVLLTYLNIYFYNLKKGSKATLPRSAITSLKYIFCYVTITSIEEH